MRSAGTPKAVETMFLFGAAAVAPNDSKAPVPTEMMRRFFCRFANSDDRRGSVAMR